MEEPPASPLASPPPSRPRDTAVSETSPSPSPSPAPAPGHSARPVSIDEFGRIDLRVAVVLAVERVVGTDRLLKLEIDLGDERRTIVSGIAHLYEPEALVGRRVVVVANLEPARIRGVESRGMLLAAGGRAPDQAFGLVTVEDAVPPGTRVS